MLNDDPVRAAVVARLVQARLLSASDDTIAVHELLAIAWPRLHDWLEEDAAAARLLGKLTAAADAGKRTANGRRTSTAASGSRTRSTGVRPPTPT